MSENNRWEEKEETDERNVSLGIGSWYEIGTRFEAGSSARRMKEREKTREKRRRNIGERTKRRNQRRCPMCLAGSHVAFRLNVHWMFQQLENETAWTSRSDRGNPWKGKGQRHPLPWPCNTRNSRRRCTVVGSQRSSRPCLSRKVSRFLISLRFASPRLLCEDIPLLLKCMFYSSSAFAFSVP